MTIFLCMYLYALCNCIDDLLTLFVDVCLVVLGLQIFLGGPAGIQGMRGCIKIIFVAYVWEFPRVLKGLLEYFFLFGYTDFSHNSLFKSWPVHLFISFLSMQSSQLQLEFTKWILVLFKWLHMREKERIRVQNRIREQTIVNEYPVQCIKEQIVNEISTYKPRYEWGCITSRFWIHPSIHCALKDYTAYKWPLDRTDSISISSLWLWIKRNNFHLYSYRFHVAMCAP